MPYILIISYEQSVILHFHYLRFEAKNTMTRISRFPILTYLVLLIRLRGAKSSSDKSKHNRIHFDDIFHI
jgi:hypothetical protein